jgi:hypothetical protein
MAALPGFDGEVEFRFSEVVSEGSSPSTANGTGDLQRLIILSPSTRVPDVSWKRSRITVRPGEGWMPNRTYRVELLPGIADLRNNRSTSAHTVLTFTTGGPVPTDTLRGRVMDWTTGRPVPRGLVDALLLPDSLSYRISADSAGNFTAAPLPAGTYLVYGVVDQNTNARREPREAYDSVTSRSNSPAISLWTFPHDTTPPRLSQATATDSVTVQLEFSQPLDPARSLDTSVVTVRHLPDSVRVPVVLLASQRVYDSLQSSRRQQAVPGDSVPPRAVPLAPPRADVQPAPDTVSGRLPLISRLMLQLASPMDTSGQYAIELRGVRNVTGISADVRGIFVAPRPVPIRVSPADSLAPGSLRTDSLPSDTLPVQADSLSTKPRRAVPPKP